MCYANGMLYTSMHGDSNDDEINIILGGRNYGWPNVEGYCNGSDLTFCTDSNVVEPIYTWTPTIAPAGMDFYDHPMFPQWQNSLFMCSLKDTSLWIMKLNSTHDSVISASRLDTLHIGRIRDICISSSGSIFLSTSRSLASGTGAKVDVIVELYDSTYVPVNVPGTQTKTNLSIYPNPTKNEVTISIKNVSLINMPYVISNAMGQLVLQGKMTNNTISVKTLSPGLYQLKLTGNTGETYTGKILKE